MSPEETAQTPSSVATPSTDRHSAAQALEPMSSSPKPRARWKRLIDWFWLGAAIADAKRARASTAGRCQELTERARVIVQLGSNVLEPTERDLNTTDAVACDLFRQSAYWAMRGLALAHGGDSSAPERDGNLWTERAEAVIRRATGESDALATLKKAVDTGSFVEFAEMPPEERTRLVQTLQKGAEALLAELDRPARALEMLWFQRALRIGLVFAVLGAVVLGKSWMASEHRRDIAAGKPWRQSSMSNHAGCEPPLQSCSNSPNFFFHTSEERSPSIEIDLGQAHRFSAVRVMNREDCCGDRAVPLVVEVSVDQKEWREVARRSEVFSSWLAEFPTVEARWLRLRVDRQSFLHLAGVLVLP